MSATSPDAPLARWIRPEMLLPDLLSHDGPGVLAEIAAAMARADGGISGRAALAGFLEREALGSTAVGDGFAIPHCRLAGLGGVRLAVARHASGVDFGALDGRPVTTFFALAAPQSGATAHLEALGAIARFLRVPANRQAVAQARGAGDVLAVLQGVRREAEEHVDV